MLAGSISNRPWRPAADDSAARPSKTRVPFDETSAFPPSPLKPAPVDEIAPRNVVSFSAQTTT